MGDKSENILIRYTKWILKWFAIVCVVIGVVVGGWFGYFGYQDQIVPMIAIECEYEPDRINPKRHYLVQKRRNSSSPHALYRPSYYNAPINLEASPDDYWKQYPFEQTGWWKDRPVHSFAPPSYDNLHGLRRHLIIRDNLQVIHLTKDKKSEEWKSETIGKCRQITFDEFYAESERGLNERKSKLKF